MTGTTSMIRLIAGREIRERLRAKSYLIFTGILVLVIIAIGVVVRVAGDDGGDATVIGVSESAPADLAGTMSRVAQFMEHEITVVEIDAADAERALEDGEIDVALLAEAGRVIHAGQVDTTMQAIVQQSWTDARVQEALATAGPAADDLAAVVLADPLEAVSLDDEDGLTGLALLTGFVVAILLFISVQIFGNYALTGVAEEKTTAVVELLLVRVRSDQLLAGKLLGIGVVAVVQFAAAVGAGLVSLAISGTDVPSEVWAALPMALVWYLGGFAFYATLFALAGSLVSRQEDAQAAAGPISAVLIGAYVSVYIFGYDPTAMASRVLSVLPPFAPFLMPMRMMAGAASVVEVVGAVAFLAGATVLTWKLASRIYERVLLHRGSRIPWRDAIRLLRSPT